MPILPLAHAVFARHARLHALTHYTGILSLQGLARLALATGGAAIIAQARDALLPFVRGERGSFGNFQTYHVGGNGTALLFRAGHLPEAEAPLLAAAEAQLAAPRGRDGVFTRPSGRHRDLGLLWIDSAFAVCPFFAEAGVALGRDDYIDEAVCQILPLRAILLNPANGLVHQGVNFDERGIVSDDHWSRSNGWGLLALAEIIAALPADHRARPACAEALTTWLEAALAWQNYEGLWFQEMTALSPKTTYTETSGSGLILYALGVALQHGLLPDAVARPAFERGIAGLMRYVFADGTVLNCCVSCCCPGRGEIADFLQRPPMRDDWHAFGPIILVLAQAHALGYREITAFPDAPWRNGYHPAVEPSPNAASSPVTHG